MLNPVTLPGVWGKTQIVTHTARATPPSTLEGGVGRLTEYLSVCIAVSLLWGLLILSVILLPIVTAERPKMALSEGASSKMASYRRRPR